MTLTVNGKEIDCSLIKQEAERLRPAYEKVFAKMEPEKREAQLLDWSKENVIERVLLNQHAEKNGKSVDKGEIEAVFEQLKKDYGGTEGLYNQLSMNDDQQIKKAIELRIKVRGVLLSLCKDIPSPSKQDISKFYNENKEHFSTPEKIRVSHIVKHINFQTDENSAHDAIQKANEELASGSSFETLVTKYSDCPDNSGDLGYITKGQMVEEFEDVVFNLAPGQVTDIFRTRFGFHIAKLYDRKPPEQKTLEQVTEQIKKQLAEDAQKQTIDQFLDRLKEDANIEESPAP